MKIVKIYCIFCDNYRKFKNTKVYIFQKALGVSIIGSNCGNKCKIYLKKKSIKKLKTLGLIADIE